MADLEVEGEQEEDASAPPAAAAPDDDDEEEGGSWAWSLGGFMPCRSTR